MTLNMMLFSLLHYPCSTTLINIIYKETKSYKWTFIAFIIPTMIALGVTYGIAQLARAMGGIESKKLAPVREMFLLMNQEDDPLDSFFDWKNIVNENGSFLNTE